jgi:hypothetical protein
MSKKHNRSLDQLKEQLLQEYLVNMLRPIVAIIRKPLGSYIKEFGPELVRTSCDKLGLFDAPKHEVAKVVRRQLKKKSKRTTRRPTRAPMLGRNQLRRWITKLVQQDLAQSDSFTITDVTSELDELKLKYARSTVSHMLSTGQIPGVVCLGHINVGRRKINSYRFDPDGNKPKVRSKSKRN